MKFKKSDLRTGMRLKINGITYLVLIGFKSKWDENDIDCIVDIDPKKCNWEKLKNVNMDNVECVMLPDHPYSMTKNNDINYNYKVIACTKEMTVQQISDELGYEVKVIK